MPRFLKITLITIGVVILIFMIWSKYSYDKVYNDYFRLSEKEVSEYLKTIQDAECRKISECNLLPGDILIRRYKTERTELFDDFFNPYFMHAAVYIGNNEYFEAFGFEDNSEDDIRTSIFDTSDWLNEDLNTFIIIRLKNNKDKTENIIKKLKEIAEDPEYVFGLPKKPNDKKTSCADVIVKTLQKEKIIEELDSEPKIISPDYLFLITITDKENFEIVGYN